MRDFFKVIWPASWLTWLGLVLGALSVLRLVEVSFAYEFVPSIAGVIDAYERLLKAIVEIELPWWVGPAIDQLVDWLNDVLGLHLTLFDHWKHVFVLTGVYVFRNIAPPFRNGHIHTGVFNIFWGWLIALGSGIGAGSIDIAGQDALSNFLVVAIPVAGGFVYETGRGVWGTVFHRKTRATLYGQPIQPPLSYFGKWMTKVVFRSGGLMLLVLLGLVFGAFAASPNPGIAMYGAMTLLFALILIGEGLWDTRTLQRKEGERWLEAFGRTYQGGHGLAMLGVFAQAGLVVAANELLRSSGAQGTL
jgi:hypothetical protein